MQFVYGVLYLSFEAFPIIYEEGHGLSAGLEGLVFLPLFLGGAVGCLLVRASFVFSHTVSHQCLQIS